MNRAEEGLEGSRALPVVLFTYMRETRETGRFWLIYGARKSWVFDAMYWKYLNERFFDDRASDIPNNDLCKSKVHLVSEKDKEAMKPLVERKMNKSKNEIIAGWESINRLSELSFD